MTQLIHLMDEICNGVEIYFTGRTGGQYLKTAFILCDDYTELTSKLFLLTKDPKWSEKKDNGKYKNYYNVQEDVQKVIEDLYPKDLPRLKSLHSAMKERRGRRNDFFHSTRLLDLGVVPRNCVDSFCDLLDYGQLLFGKEWTGTVSGARNLDVFELMLRLEKKSFGDPSVMPKVNEILSQLPRNHPTNVPKKGAHVAKYPDDLHTRLSVIYGGPEFRDKLAKLL